MKLLLAATLFATFVLVAFSGYTTVDHYYLDDRGYCRHRYENKIFGLIVVGRFDESVADSQCPVLGGKQ